MGLEEQLCFICREGLVNPIFVSVSQASSIDNELPYVEVSSSRTRLRDIYRALLIENLEVALDQKIEQELWNQCYKNPINQLQEKQKVPTTLSRSF